MYHYQTQDIFDQEIDFIFIERKTPTDSQVGDISEWR